MKTQTTEQAFALPAVTLNVSSNSAIHHFHRRLIRTYCIGAAIIRSMPRLELFLFRCRDVRTGKWIQARYRVEQHEIAGAVRGIRDHRPPEIRETDRDRQRFSPHGGAAEPGRRAMGKKAQRRFANQAISPIVEPASLRGLERVLLLVFLRRYVTYCARRRRFAAMNGAARLHDAIAAQVGGG